MILCWLDPQACDPPHGVTHPDKEVDLAREFHVRGWHPDHPALVGYELGRRVQLLSGSHRWAAAKMAGIKIPVVVHPEATIVRAYGDLDAWKTLMHSGDRNVV